LVWRGGRETPGWDCKELPGSGSRAATLRCCSIKVTEGTKGVGLLKRKRCRLYEARKARSGFVRK